MTIRSGAGGVDAADFAEMLMRMYLRWAERHGYPTQVLDTSYAEEAGLKSATFEVKVPYAFGNLSVEAGTHRLVRISPFDNQGRRQTSFAAVEVVPLIEQTDHIDIPETEIKVDVFRSSGPGGQSVNTTDSAVRLTHLPTGIVVSMQNEKSQIQNRAAALRVLQSRLLLQRQAEEKATQKELAGDIKASWGDQMRSYVLQPYQMVKDLRTEHEVGNPSAVFDGDIDGFIEAGIRWRGRRRSGLSSIAAVTTLVLTVIGDDRAGLVKALADVVQAHDGNWERSHLAELSGTFAGVVEVSVPEPRAAELQAALRPLEGLLDVKVHTGTAHPPPRGTRWSSRCSATTTPASSRPSPARSPSRA